MNPWMELLDTTQKLDRLRRHSGGNTAMSRRRQRRWRRCRCRGITATIHRLPDRLNNRREHQAAIGEDGRTSAPRPRAWTRSSSSCSGPERVEQVADENADDEPPSPDHHSSGVFRGYKDLLIEPEEQIRDEHTPDGHERRTARRTPFAIESKITGNRTLAITSTWIKNDFSIAFHADHAESRSPTTAGRQ